jgi:hypothetical protein
LSGVSFWPRFGARLIDFVLQFALPSGRGLDPLFRLPHRFAFLWADRLFQQQKNPQEQRHGDERAHTVVTRRSNGAPDNLRGVGQFLVALFCAILLDVALVKVGVLLHMIA